jgi:hypothetical protein
MKPPIETHRPRMNERHVKYLTGLSFSAVVESAREGVGAWEENWDSSAGFLRLVIKLETPMMNKLPSSGVYRVRG